MERERAVMSMGRWCTSDKYDIKGRQGAGCMCVSVCVGNGVDVLWNRVLAAFATQRVLIDSMLDVCGRAEVFDGRMQHGRMTCSMTCGTDDCMVGPKYSIHYCRVGCVMKRE
jgi:hypothetical protein